MGPTGHLYISGRWTVFDPTDPVPIDSGAWLALHVIEPNMTSVAYHPAGIGSGLAWLGSTPRVAYGNPEESDPTDTEREAQGLSAWARTVTGRTADHALIKTFLASDNEDDYLEDPTVSYKTRTRDFLLTLGLPSSRAKSR